MTTRRALFLAALSALTAAWATALPETTAPLEVTFYFLPG